MITRGLGDPRLDHLDLDVRLIGPVGLLGGNHCGFDARGQPLEFFSCNGDVAAARRTDAAGEYHNGYGIGKIVPPEHGLAGVQFKRGSLGPAVTFQCEP